MMMRDRLQPQGDCATKSGTAGVGSAEPSLTTSKMELAMANRASMPDSGQNHHDQIENTKVHFLGRVCKTCGSNVRYIKSNRCVQCNRQNSIDAARKKDPSWVASQKRWKLKNKEKLAQYKRTQRERNGDKLRADSLKYYYKNREKMTERSREWDRANPEKYKARKRINEQKRRSRLAGVEGSFNRIDFQEIMSAQRNKCALCRKKLDQSAHADHIIPLSKGGSNFRKNIQALCFDCNTAKGAKDPIDFNREKGLLL